MRFPLAPAVFTLACLACGNPTPRRSGTVLFASGADLQSMNPLITIHPLAKQVQRYVLLMTLVRYDSLLEVEPYLARSWEWSGDRRTVTMFLSPEARWHDGTPTTARDAAWTLNAARDPVTGYPRQQEMAEIDSAFAIDDTTLMIRFRTGQDRIPDVLTDLAVAPSSRLDSVPRARMREAPWNRNPVGNGPFRFVSHETNRRWVFVADSTFPAELGGPPSIDRLVIAIVDEPTTKLAALTAGELDFAGINPAHASFVRDNPDLRVVDYPLIFTYGIILNTRQPPFDDYRVRQAVNIALDRREIVNGYLYG
ncbi:MAG: ABC transporter substrate-binding protein, partial [Gemmatimonadales bacterium]